MDVLSNLPTISVGFVKIELKSRNLKFKNTSDPITIKTEKKEKMIKLEIKLKLHLLRGAFVVSANMLFFLGLAEIPLSEATAIFFVSPLIITLFSVIFLSEKVGPWRWFAVIMGLVGAVVMLRPSLNSFQLAGLFPIGAAFCYASLHILTRKMGRAEKATTMSFY